MDPQGIFDQFSSETISFEKAAPSRVAVTNPTSMSFHRAILTWVSGDPTGEQF
jgi:hypothetical protein